VERKSSASWSSNTLLGRATLDRAGRDDAEDG